MPVLIFNQNGTITTKRTLKEAIDLSTSSKMLMVVTSNQTINANLTIPVGTSFSITNGAVITVNSGITFNINGSFDAPTTNAWLNNLGGTVNIDSHGSVLQNFNGNAIYAQGGFFGNLTGNVNGSIASALVATNASGTGNIASAAGNGMRLICGQVNSAGVAVGGVGFTSARNSQGNYSLTFQGASFTTLCIIAGENTGAGVHGSFEVVVGGNTAAVSFWSQPAVAYIDVNWTFLAMGY